ncbi:hypothetical protein V6N13_080825 [Hibiscus sabdariffa]|uniref:RNase H type-1 domain-containing protein n=2 Tax=Hibiscus sabdariffa TaxID=183260 RepID=A0ABR2CC62_9ROSI
MPTFANLQHRYLQVRNTCPLCVSAADTVAHMVFSCPIVLQILTSVGLPPAPTIQNPTVSEDFISWFIHLSKGHQLLLSITYWSVWGSWQRFSRVTNGGLYLPHTGVADSFAAEAKACERAVIFAMELGFRSVIVEGDSLTIIKKLNSTTLDKSEVSPIIRDILSLKISFDNITFSFVGRSENASAHEMAKLGRQFGEARYWIEEAPALVEQLILRERST